MAKLSAKGRTEVLRLERVQQPENLYSDIGDIGPTIKTELALMSDNVVLRKITWIRADGTRHNLGWKVRGKLKDSQTPASFRDAYTTREPMYAVTFDACGA